MAHVANGALDGGEAVNVTVIDYTYSAKAHFEGEYRQAGTYVVNLTWDATNSRFTGAVGQSLTMSTYVAGDDDVTLHVYELATEVNGNWLTDPLSGSHNFRYIPNDQNPGYCGGDNVPVD